MGLSRGERVGGVCDQAGPLTAFPGPVGADWQCASARWRKRESALAGEHASSYAADQCARGGCYSLPEWPVSAGPEPVYPACLTSEQWQAALAAPACL